MVEVGLEGQLLQGVISKADLQPVEGKIWYKVRSDTLEGWVWCMENISQRKQRLVGGIRERY